MLQAIMPEPGQVEIRDIQVPVPGADEVLLRIQRIGICGSDIHVFHGQHPLTPYPVVQGHEFSALVEAVGDGVSNIQPGMRVTAMPQIVCGKCSACTSGKEHICHELKVQGFQAPGCAQELWVTKAARIIPLPEKLNYDAGAFVEPTAVGVHAIACVPGFVGSRVLVLGAGPIGNLLAQAAKASGAKRVALFDVNDTRLSVARECGLEYALNTQKLGFEFAVAQAFGDEGYDLVFDCAGVQGALTQALNKLQKGGAFVVVAVYPKPVQVDLTLVQDRELRILGTLMYQKPDYVRAIELLSEGDVQVSPLISKHFPIKEYAAAYDYAISQKDQVMKVLIDVAN